MKFSQRVPVVLCMLLVFMSMLPAFVVMFPGAAAAAYSQVITFGADLTAAQRSMLASEFGVNLAQADRPVTEITNAEERKYLSGLVPEETLGTRAISSAMVEMLPAGQGIRVTSRNITWVTDDMYANALVTAGVRDAGVTVAAPFPVSGTAALTGIFKAVEVATGKSLGERPKKAASRELVETGSLGEEIGRDKAVQFIVLVKQQVIAERTANPERIRQIVINVAGDLNLNLNNRQVEEVTGLMQEIRGLNLRAEDLTGQLQSYKDKLEAYTVKQEEVKGWIQRVLDILDRLIQQIRAALLGE
ncbi:DUF1002 domain-containing protein [Phosphitispora fastidiosa]|uniref:DUF1002 domain-containing protein n=1 Tax=Phosphitispora fastidiosa TaxID=2837202 RepID=UPI001E50D021|nr:DUF1002 domain-containing protein [Phosphitispora fastidiosa]MBU7007489.1 putative protein YpuA [Phosphitispora fastidiosa]